MRTQLLGFFCMALLACPLAAHSEQITYAFTVIGGSSGPLALQTASGTFTYDSSVIPAAGGSVSEYGLLGGLSFTWDDISYTAQTANTGQMIFTSSGALLLAAFGSDCPGGVCSLVNGSTDWFVSVGPGSEFFSGSFTYDVPGYPSFFSGAVGPATLGTEVPEPGAVALLGIGLSSLLYFVRRRRMGRSSPDRLSAS